MTVINIDDYRPVLYTVRVTHYQDGHLDFSVDGVDIDADDENRANLADALRLMADALEGDDKQAG